jgi:putative transcriptional regulator
MRHQLALVWVASAHPRHVSPVKRLRWKLGLSQADFAERFQVPVGMLRDWEQRHSVPNQAALSYLKVIEADADFVARAVAAHGLRHSCILERGADGF